MNLRPATLFDLAGVRSLLTAARLPPAGITEHFGGFVVAEEEGRIVAAGGLEVHGSTGLVRSVVVARTHRGRGLGRAVLRQLLADADARGLRDVYLFTESAEAFFAREGFGPMDRADAPRVIKGNPQFTTHCADTATLMHRSRG